MSVLTPTVTVPMWEVRIVSAKPGEGPVVWGRYETLDEARRHQDKLRAIIENRVLVHEVLCTVEVG